MDLHLFRVGIIGFVLLKLTAAPAQTGTRIFHHLTIADGLSQNSVNAVLQDRDGFLWFGTQDGLDRYDGRGFIPHRHSARANSLSNNYVWALHEDRQGALWIGTFGGGLDRYDPETGDLAHHRHVANDSSSLPSDRIFSIVEDPRGTLWLGTNNGLASFDPGTRRARRWLSATLNESEGRGHFVNALALQGETLWMRTDSGLTELDTRTGAIQHHARSPFSGNGEFGNVQSITVHDDVLYVTCQAGLMRIDGKARHDTLLLRPADVPNADARMFFSRLCIDGDRWWIGSSRGLVQWDPGAGHIALHRHDAADPNSLAHDNILALVKGRGGELWIGTRNGLDRLDRPDPMIGLLRGIPGKPNTLCDRSVNALAEMDGGLWIGTPNGLNYWDRVRDTLLAFKHDARDPASLPSDYVLSLFRDRSGQLWVGTRGGGLARCERKGSALHCKRFQHGDAPGAINANTIHAITQDRSGTMWIGTAGGGLCSMAPGTERFTCHAPTGDDRGPSHPYIYCIAEDAHGHLWLGTPTGGLNLFDPESGRFVAMKNRADDPLSISNDIVLWSLIEGDTLWAGTSNGLDRLIIDDASCAAILKDPMQARFARYGRDEGLPNEVVYGMLRDVQGQFWLSTNLGIAEFDPVVGRATRTLSVADGLQNNEFNQNAFLRSSAGELFFGGVDGLNFFRPEQLVPNAYVPPVRFTRFLLKNEGVPLRAEDSTAAFALERSIMRTERIELSWREKVIGLEFAALNYVAPGKNRYRYKLEGFDEAWTEAGTRNNVTYTNLDPGEYTLRVQGSNNDGVWNEAGSAIALRIATPPWLTWYAYTFYALVMLALAYAWYRHRLRQATRELATELRVAEARSQEREDFRRKSAADFHDESGAKLTRINLHTGLAKQRAGQDPAIGAHLEHIEQAHRELSAGIRDLIWSMDPGRDTLNDVVDRLSAFALPLFDRTDTRFKLEGRTEDMKTVTLDMEKRRAITLIMKEAMNNCAKHAQATHCTLSISHTDDRSIFRLKDDGKGFDPAATRSDGYGTRTMPERARSVGAELHISSAPGTGTEVLLSLPIG